MSRQLLETLVPQHWDSQKPGAPSGFNRVRWLQGVNDLLNRPVVNRGTASTSNTGVILNGAGQSTGIGIGALQPKRYGEFTVKARVTFNLSAAGPAFLYVVRTLGAIPAQGAGFNLGDVTVGGDAFAGGQLPALTNQCASFSFLDTGLDVTKQYKYYFAVLGPAGKTLNLINNSQLLVMERS